MAFQGLDIREGPLLRELTSIRLGGPALAELRVSSARGLEQLPDVAGRLGGRIEPFGAGTNIIARDQDLPLVLVTRKPWHETQLVGEINGRALIRADAAAKLPTLLARAASLGLGGLEGLTGIPGSVGGAVAMNAGSYGVSIGELAHSVEVFSPARGLVEVPATDFAFAYRSCRWVGVDGWFLITGVTLALDSLDKAGPGPVRRRMREVYAKKRASQPVTAKSAGCVFKNPAPDAPAGRLLEAAGLKGMSRGGMCFSAVHANFLVNDGEGAAEDAMYLIELARERVYRESGYLLETEVRIWP